MCQWSRGRQVQGMLDSKTYQKMLGYQNITLKIISYIV